MKNYIYIPDNRLLRKITPNNCYEAGTYSHYYIDSNIIETVHFGSDSDEAYIKLSETDDKGNRKLLITFKEIWEEIIQKLNLRLIKDDSTKIKIYINTENIIKIGFDESIIENIPTIERIFIIFISWARINLNPECSYRKELEQKYKIKKYN